MTVPTATDIDVRTTRVADYRIWFEVVAPMRLGPHVLVPVSVARSVLLAIATEAMMFTPPQHWPHGTTCNCAHVWLTPSRLAYLAEVDDLSISEVLAFLRDRNLISPIVGHVFHLTVPQPSAVVPGIKSVSYFDDPPPVGVDQDLIRAKPVSLYRWYDSDDRLLYIGISKALARRQDNHARASSWEEYAERSIVERYPDRATAEAAEKVAIRTEQPLFNRQHNDTPEARARLVTYLVEKGRLDLLAPAVSRG